ncbi:MAG: tryptophanase [Bradymonadales bacterium]|jgi:tyrosine phenol-lyase
MSKIKFYTDLNVPLEMHKVRIVQKLELLPVEARVRSIREAGFNTFLLQNKDVYLDMLTDSGVNAMSDKQQAAMFTADDAYAGSTTFTRLQKKLEELFKMKYFLPTHQGRAAENIICLGLSNEGQCCLMNYHFTTMKAHLVSQGATICECMAPEGIEVRSNNPFKGNADLKMMREEIESQGRENICFVRMEAGTNLIGGQPFSLANLRSVRDICVEYGLPLVLDASLLADNLFFIKRREEECKDWSIREITAAIADCCDVIYFSARKLGFARGGGICVREESMYRALRGHVAMYEGFLTYGGMSVREMEAITIGLEETMDEDYIRQSPEFIEYMVNALVKRGIPVVTPAGGLGVHLNAMEFVEHIPQTQYPACALAAACYISGGIRGMERGTLSEQRNPDGSEPLANMELLRLALPRRVFTLSQVEYAIDRIVWLYDQRKKISGLRWVEEPEILRFFFGRLEPFNDWPEELAEQFRKDFGDSL